MTKKSKPEKTAVESSTVVVGQRFRYYRKRHGWTQNAVALRLPSHLPLGSSGVSRLEQADIAKLYRSTIETICTACNYSKMERQSLLIAADRNPLADSDGITPAWKEALFHAISHYFDEQSNPTIKMMIEGMLGERGGYELTQLELREIMREIRRLGPL